MCDLVGEKSIHIDSHGYEQGTALQRLITDSSR